MCRFLLVKSESNMNHGELIGQFAKMCRQSRTLDNDWQGDGWGISWWKGDGWHSYHSLNPIWEDAGQWQQFPEVKMLMVHARSASFEQHKDKLTYNQPYLSDNCSFVFNGLVRGVNLDRPIPGEIGAQKIFNILLENADFNLSESIIKTHREIKKNSKQIQGFNLGVSDGKDCYAFSDFIGEEEYFRLRRYNGKQLKMICSEEFGSFDWIKTLKNKVIKI